MAGPTEHVDPVDVCGVNERIRAWAADGESARSVDIKHVVVADDAIDELVDLVRSLSGGGRTLLVVDRTPMLRGGHDLKRLVEDRLASVVPLTVRRLPDESVAEPLPHCNGSDACSVPSATSVFFQADIEWPRRLVDGVRACAAVVSVGSGSVTDVVKYARHLAGSGADRGASVPPFICFPTAASVTAYTSALAVLTVDGVKRTLAARAPDAVVCDLQTLADAPKAMTLAGFGDVLARSVSYADWFVADQLGMTDGFSRLPARLLKGAEQAMIDHAEQVAVADLAGVRCVNEALLLAGMAMSIVNQTAPVSGWEHVISHFLDVTARADHRAPALHGAQVGVATLIAARAYERSWPDLDLDRLGLDADLPACRHTVAREFGGLDANGRIAAEIWRDLQKKLNRWNAVAEARRVFAERTKAGEYDAFVAASVRPSAEVAAALARATAPQRFADLTEPIPAATALRAVLHSHLIRARFTMGDLLSQSGWLSQDSAALLLGEPGTTGIH